MRTACISFGRLRLIGRRCSFHATPGKERHALLMAPNFLLTHVILVGVTCGSSLRCSCVKEARSVCSSNAYGLLI